MRHLLHGKSCNNIMISDTKYNSVAIGKASTAMDLRNKFKQRNKKTKTTTTTKETEKSELRSRCNRM